MNKPVPSPPIPFIDLQAQRRRLGDRIDKAVMAAIDHGAYVMGPEIGRLETALAGFCGARDVVSCGSGTDALVLCLMALGAGPGDAVLCPSFTFAATAEAVALVGATPVFVDIDAATFNMAPDGLAAGLTAAAAHGLKPAGIIPVDLFGQPADYDAILPFAEAEGLWTILDAAQSFGAAYKGRKIGSLGLTATSFFPAKPLGCYGDGGAVFVQDEETAAVLRSLRVHGQGTDKYDNVRIGLNARMDTVQAAILLEKLAIFPDEIEARDHIAARYAEGLKGVCTPPSVAQGSTSVWAQYVIRIADRDGVAERLKARGVPTAIYYPKSLHRQTAYRDFPVAGGALPVSDRLAGEVLALPMHPYLEPDLQDRIMAEVVAAAA